VRPREVSSPEFCLRYELRAVSWCHEFPHGFVLMSQFRREATPSSRPPVGLSDEESSQAQAADEHRHRHRGPSSAAATTAVACRARTPPAAEEIEEFFAAAEKAVAERFAAK
jgi:hypothetical protein